MEKLFCKFWQYPARIIIKYFVSYCLLSSILGLNTNQSIDCWEKYDWQILSKIFGVQPLALNMYLGKVEYKIVSKQTDPVLAKYMSITIAGNLEGIY